MTDDNSNKLRAVFLAALMVLWVFAGTVAFAGSAAAVSDGDLDNTSVNDIGDNSAGATTTYNISTQFTGTNDSSPNPSGVAAVELDFSEAGQFGGDVDNFTSADNVSVTIEDPNWFAYDETGYSRNVPLQANYSSGDTVVLDFQDKENVSDDATLYVNFTDDVINNPNVGDTYEVQFRSYTDAGTSGNYEAQNASYTISGQATGDDDERETDRKFSGDETVWKGQQLDFKANPSCPIDDESFQLRYYDPDQTDLQGTLIREISLNDSYGAQIPTKNVADNEEVVITAINTNSDQREVVDVGNSNDALPNGEQTGDCFSTTESDADDDEVEVVPQSLDAEFENDETRRDEDATLEVDSNRNGYDAYFDSDDFTQSELLAIVNNSNDNINVDRAPSSDSVRVNDLNSSARLKFDFSDEDLGNYTFTVSPTDTTPTDDAEIEVVEELTGNGEFDSDTGAFRVKRGDIQSQQGNSEATISVENINDADYVVIVIGDEGRNNYETAVTAEPDSDNRVDIRMNTFLAGNVDETDEGDAYEAINGNIVDVDRRSPKLTGVLDEGQYDLTLETTDGDTVDRGVLNIERSSYENLTQMRHPDTTLNQLDRKDELAGNEDLSETGMVTLADRDRSNQRDVLVHKIDISGVYGALDALADQSLDDAGADVLDDAQSEDPGVGQANDAILNVSLTQINFAQNTEPKVEKYVDPDSDEWRFVIDEDNETLYVVSDVRDLRLERETGSGTETGVEINPGDDFEMEFEVGPGFNETFEGGIDKYKPEGGTTTQLDVEDREAEFDEQGADRVRVNNDANQTISGQTNVAPGTNVVIQVDSTSRQRRANDTDTSDLTPIFARDTVEVQDDGSFSSDVFDFSDNEVGRRFVVSSPGTGYEDDAQKPGIVVEGTPASVALSDITVPADQDELSSVTVDEVYLPTGGFVTIHDGTLSDDPIGSVRGTSDYLGEGNHSDVEVSLDDPYTEDGEAIAMPHQDTDENEEYDFVSSGGEDDAPYTVDDTAVTATASVTFETPTPTPTASPTPTESPTESPTDSPTPDEDQPGFGAALALIALIGAALLAARRRDF
jgi:surface glycoprotein (TIGR04207 family)/PGF-CTERM protein